MSRGGWQTIRVTVSLQFLTSCMTWSLGAFLTSSPLMVRIWSPGINLFTLGPPLVTNLKKKQKFHYVHFFGNLLLSKWQRYNERRRGLFLTFNQAPNAKAYEMVYSANELHLPICFLLKLVKPIYFFFLSYESYFNKDLFSIRGLKR